MASRIYPVSTINSYIHDVVTSDELLADLWIEGEITKISTPRSGHIYFTLGEGNASIDAVMWRSAAARQRFVPRQGEAVVIHGQADYYQVQGRLQIQTDVFEHQGQGLMSLEFERLRQKLESEGLFDEARKRQLPVFPRRIGVVTSSSGAVWHDIQTVARHRFPLVELVLIPAAVQGDHAPTQIAEAIQYANGLHDLDVLIVGRGGGSPDDLAAFNSEIVARAVFGSGLPVISAVGHETDISICDLVADLRAATPSAAAELALPDAAVLRDNLADRQAMLTNTVVDELAGWTVALSGLHHRCLLQSPTLLVTKQRVTLDTSLAMASKSMKSTIDKHNSKLHVLSSILGILHPHDILRRGFSVVENANDGTTITSISELPASGEVVARFHDGVATGNLRREPGA